MTQTFSQRNRAGNFLLGASKVVITAAFGIGMAWLPYQSGVTAQTCNPFGCSKPGAAPCNPFGCPAPGAGPCNPFGCPASPAYWERHQQDWVETRGSDWEEDRYRDRDEIYDELDEIYQEVLGRRADRQGLRTYRRHLESGWSLKEVRRDITNSKEARDRRR